MIEEFNLSEKIITAPNGISQVILPVAVKEFIKIFLAECWEEQFASDNEDYKQGLQWAKIRLSVLAGEKLK